MKYNCSCFKATSVMASQVLAFLDIFLSGKRKHGVTGRLQDPTNNFGYAYEKPPT